jgi:hypothetical protein
MKTIKILAMLLSLTLLAGCGGGYAGYYGPDYDGSDAYGLGLYGDDYWPGGYAFGGYGYHHDHARGLARDFGHRGFTSRGAAGGFHGGGGGFHGGGGGFHGGGGSHGGGGGGHR